MRAIRPLARPVVLSPLMSFDLFGYRQFAMGTVVAFIYGTALFGSTYLLPVFMQRGLVLALLCRHHPAAGRIHSGRHHCAGRAAGRSPARAPAGQHRPAAAGQLFALMVTVNTTTSLFVLVALGDHWAYRPRLHPAVAQPWLDARALIGR